MTFVLKFGSLPRLPRVKFANENAPAVISFVLFILKANFHSTPALNNKEWYSNWFSSIPDKYPYFFMTTKHFFGVSDIAKPRLTNRFQVTICSWQRIYRLFKLNTAISSKVNMYYYRPRVICVVARNIFKLLSHMRRGVL